MISDSTIEKAKLNFPIVETNPDGTINITSIKDGSGGNFGVEYTTFKQGTSNALDQLRQDIEDSANYDLYIETPNGTNIWGGNIQLNVKLLKNNVDVTDEFDASCFIWTRTSRDHDADLYWNSNHRDGAKVVTITGNDVRMNADFQCKFEYENVTVVAGGNNMAKIQAFSSVSVVDLTDVGVINFYLTSNQPNSVIYDPNTNGGTYSPNWASSRLDITPVISYNGSNLALTATGLTITYQRKEGNGTATDLTTGETVVGGVLQVSANKLANVSSGQLTYLCNITYTDPDSGVPISSQASLTYNLVTMASELKYAGITGENTFLYDTSRKIVGTGIITLTADLTNCSVTQWQYKKSDGTFAAFPTTNNASINGNTLEVHHDESGIWLNDKIAIIKLVTNDNDIYDITQINKIYDVLSFSNCFGININIIRFYTYIFRK